MFPQIGKKKSISANKGFTENTPHQDENISINLNIIIIFIRNQ